MVKRWQPSEIHIMLTEFELVGSNGVQELLPHRSISAIQHRAKLLNLKMKKRTAKPNKSDKPENCEIHLHEGLYEDITDYKLFDKIFALLYGDMDSMPIEQQEELFTLTNPDHFVKVDLTNGIRTVKFVCKRCGSKDEGVGVDIDYKVDCAGCAKMLTKAHTGKPSR